MTIDIPAPQRIGAALIAECEGTVLHPYWDTRGRIWTIGSGLTRLNGVAVTGHTMPITAAEDAYYVGLELGRSFDLIDRVLPNVALTDAERGALASFTFNVGGGGLALYGKPSMVASALLAGQRQAAWDGLRAWCHAGGVYVGGLADRRELERAVALGNVDALAPGALSALHAQITAKREGRSPAPSAQPTADDLNAAELSNLKG